MNSHVNDTRCEEENGIYFSNLEHLIEQRKDAEVIKILDETPILFSIADAAGRSLLHAATEHENLTIMEYLIKGGCDINAKTVTGCTALMIATSSYRSIRDPRIIEMLLNCDSDILATNSNGQSALQLHLINLRFRDLPVIDLFAEKVKTRSIKHEDLLDIFLKIDFPLEKLVHLRNIEVTNMFLDKRSRIDEKDDRAAIYICMKFNYEENLRILLQYRHGCGKRRQFFVAQFQKTLRRNETANFLRKIDMLVRVLIDLEVINLGCITNINNMYIHTNEKSLCELLKTNLNSFLKSKLDYEPITYVFGNSKPGIFELIQREKLDVNVRGFHDETTLGIAVAQNLEQYVEYLLKKNVDPNIASDYDSNAPIHYIFGGGTIHSCHDACLKLLLKYNADIEACNWASKTFIEYSTDTPQNESTFKTILAHLAMLQSCGISIKTPFVNFINSRVSLTEFYKKMCQQLEQMKTHEIHYSLTLFTVLSQSYDFVSHRIRTMHPDTVKSLCSPADDKLSEYDDYYTDIIRDRVMIAYKIHQTRKTAAGVIYDYVDQLKGHLVVIDLICSFLSYEHLHKIVYPFHELDCQECKLSSITCYRFVK